MKHLKTIVISLVIGLAIGLALGVNIGREQPLLSNPFHKESLAEKAKRIGGETLEQGGKALQEAGQSLQDKLKKQ
jgi:hypothetical protein